MQVHYMHIKKNTSSIFITTEVYYTHNPDGRLFKVLFDVSLAVTLQGVGDMLCR